ncbi:MAG: hypothetical protein GTN40_05565, partial [Candidatus Aenigmarchaeota archaeon]|nr:hypothetical protein [Candidatus Aenigmarchaeota archaeon]
DLTAPSIIVSNSPLNDVYQNKYGDITVNLTISDPCLDSVWWSKDNGVTNNSINLPYDINITNWARDNYTLLILANDTLNNLNVTTYPFVIDNPPNITYYFPDTTNLSLAENSSLDFFHTSTDPDSDILTYFWQLDGITQNTTQNWTFYPGFFDAGIRNITLIVFDGDLSVTQYWNVTVNNTNRPPIWDQIPENQAIEEDTNLTYDVNASDLDNEIITYYVNDTNFIINSSTGVLTYTPPLNWYGIIYVTLAASDDIDNITVNISVNLTPVNDAPVLDLIPNITINESDLVNITVNASDVEGDDLTYSINDTKFTKTDQSFIWQTTYQDSDLYTVNISVNDSIESNWQIVFITVLEVEDADNDGLNNSEDYLFGDRFSINTTLDINITINGSSNLSQIFNGTLQVDIIENNNSLIEFKWDFNQTNILNLSSISIEKQPNTSTNGYIIVKGINLTAQNRTKTIYLDHINADLTTVCISDKDIASITEISTGCNGINETLVFCNGIIQNRYNCTSIENNTRYKITGLTHSGISEQCSDNDKDNYGIGCTAGIDCNDNDPTIHPGASELCDAVDNNCDGNVDEGCDEGGGGVFFSGGGGGFVPPSKEEEETIEEEPKKQVPEEEISPKKEVEEKLPEEDEIEEEKEVEEMPPETGPAGLFLGLAANDLIIATVAGVAVALVIIFGILMKKRKRK